MTKYDQLEPNTTVPDLHSDTYSMGVNHNRLSSQYDLMLILVASDKRFVDTSKHAVIEL